MPKTNLPSLAQLKTDFPAINFELADDFYWSAQHQQLFYQPAALKTSAGMFQLFHELGHALLNHRNFESGVELLQLETEAWAKARTIAQSYNLTLDETQVQNSLDSYRDWLHQRSTCPSCNNISVEITDSHYRCFNCQQQWTVPVNQRSRGYRLKVK